MLDLDRKYPQYGFAQHKGYPTKAHMDAVAKHGPCDVHRRTFAPLKTWFPLPAPAAEPAEDSSATTEKKGAPKKRKRRA